MVKRNISTFLFFCCLLFSSKAIGQENKVPEPETINVVYYLDSSNNALVALERQTAQAKVKLRSLGFGANTTVEIKGEKSSVRFKVDQKMQFVVQLPNGIDPAKFQLYIFEVKKDKRQVLISQMSMLKGKSGPGAVQTNVSKHGQSSYKLTSAVSLAPGEYGFSASDSNEVFCFGIDPAK